MNSVFIASMLGAFTLSVGCGDDRPIAPSTTNAASAPASSPAPPMATPPAPSPNPADIPNSSLVVTGPIIVEHQLDLTAQRDGVVTKLLSDVSSRVKAGALMAQLDDRQIVANLEAARAKTRSIDAEIRDLKAESEVIQADYGRAQRRWDLGVISEEELQHAKYKAESEQWNIKQVVEQRSTAVQEERSLEIELEKTRITAPFSGLVARRYVREGQSVAKGDRLFWITAESPLMMRFTLPEKYFGRLHHGQKFEVTSADLPGEKHTASVREISPVIDPASGTFEVLVELATDHGSDHSKFRPGMNASLHIAVDPAANSGGANPGATP
ncbi:MAG TPA: efflux RND transporter periplasmic adaptor subunit [Candidatus Eremiobacteraceae bacterium]|jgi:membrane fusion protein, multidrug efflux system|nr:efflux RND transporter periplasmic adaptor subunit [Candidatus Eremiobacteraceae bacterium]